MRKVLSSPREAFECNILFFQHKWIYLYCRGQLCSAQGNTVLELRPALQSWGHSAHSHYLALAHHKRNLAEHLLNLQAS